MCGRYTHLITWAVLREIMDLLRTDAPEGWPGPRYNIAPTQLAPVIRANEKGERAASMLRWGFAPHWSKTPDRGPINARVEGIGHKPMFRDAMKKRRCIVPASGFYEWQAVAGSKTKQPWYMTPAGTGALPIFAFAGLWESHPEVGETFCILTTEPNTLMRPIHNRMPVILEPDKFDAWLSAGPLSFDPSEPYPAPSMTAQRVGTKVNSPRTDASSLIEPVDTPPAARRSPPPEEDQGSLFR